MLTLAPLYGSAMQISQINLKLLVLLHKYRANDPNRRQANRAADLANLAGRYGQLGGFLA
jgi:hypothetical protein